MNSQRNKVFDELKNKHLKQTIQANAVVTSSTSSASPFILSSGPVTGSNTTMAPILPNQITPTTTAPGMLGIPPQQQFSSLEPMTPSQKNVAQAHQTTFGFYVPQDSIYNVIIPVLPRY